MDLTICCTPFSFDRITSCLWQAPTPRRLQPCNNQFVTMSRNFKILIGFTILLTIWFISSCIYVWQFPILRPIFLNLGNGAVTIVKLNSPGDTSWRFLGFDSGGWDWTWDFKNHTIIDLWRIRLPLWPLVFGLVWLTFWNWSRLIFRRPYLCCKCAFDLRGTISNPAKLCNECGTQWNSEFLAAQSGVAAAWSLPTYDDLRKRAQHRFRTLVTAIVFSLAFTMLLVCSYASLQEIELGETTLIVSRFVVLVTRSVNNMRFVDSGLHTPEIARQLITSYQTMPNGSFLLDRKSVV